MPAPTASISTAGEVIAAARRRLARAPFEPSTREATLLLAHVLGRDEVDLIAHPRTRLSATEADRFERLLERRLTGEPVAYLTGEREFYGRLFRVDSRVLIPRPETEHLVEAVLALDLPPRPRLLDVGTGSGCLALTLAAERPDARVVATDHSLGALAVASLNRRRLDLEERVRLVAGDLVASLRVDGFDAVVSNPPYIDPAERAGLSPEVRDFEPPTALFAPPGELLLVRRLLDLLAAVRPGTPLLLEIGLGQDEPLARLLKSTPFRLERLLPDYAGIPRVASLRRTPIELEPAP